MLLRREAEVEFMAAYFLRFIDLGAYIQNERPQALFTEGDATVDSLSCVDAYPLLRRLRADSLGRLFDEGLITKTEAFRSLDSISEPVVRRHRDDLLGAYVTSTMDELGPDRLVQYVEMLSSRMQSNHIVYEVVGPHLVARRTAEGQPFLDFEAEYEGQCHRLSDYVGRGQYVLVDFWASWCGPCRQEIPTLIEAYERYRDCGLVVLGIAAWDEPANTLKAIRDLHIPYPQILNTQKVATDLYGIVGIPHIILFSPDGTVLARGLRGPDILTKLAGVLGDEAGE